MALSANALLLVVALLVLPGCGRESARPPGEASGMATAGTVDEVPVDALRVRAEAALRERRYYTPAGDSAIDHYLALRERTPGDGGVAAALAELQPYLVIASEQAMTIGELIEAQRLLGLLTRVEASAPALPRLRDGLRRAQLAQMATTLATDPAMLAAQQAERLAVEARRREVATRAPALANSDNDRDGANRDSLSVLPPPVDASIPRPPPASSAPVPVVAQMETAPIVAGAATPQPAVVRPLPKLLKDAAPRYPLNALNRKIEGSVLVAFSIEPDGTVAGLRLVSATPAGLFEEAALAAVARWRFEATGRRVDTQRTLSFTLPK